MIQHARQVIDLAGEELWYAVVSARFKRSARHQDLPQDSFFRKGVVGDWKNAFQSAHVQCFKQVAGEALIELGYEADNNW